MAVPEGELLIDLYGGSFVRVRPSFALVQGTETWLAPVLATEAGPGGATIPDLAALRGYGHTATWYDVGGSLGKMTTGSGNDVWPSDLATWMDHGQAMLVRDEAPAADGHPHLVYLSSEAITAPEPPPDQTAVEVYVTPEQLRATVGAPSGAGTEARLALACVQASRWVDYRIGLLTVDQVQVLHLPVTTVLAPTTAARHTAALLAAVRFWRSPDVPLGIAGGAGDVAVRVASVDILDAELALEGERTSWGVA
jgi:hypothetical protein